MTLPLPYTVLTVREPCRLSFLGMLGLAPGVYAYPSDLRPKLINYADRQLEALGKKGDVAFGISTSGKSRNVIKAFEAAKLKGMITAAFTGGDGGAVAAMADIRVIVPSTVTARIQESHSTFFHAICEVVENAFVQ